MSAEQQRPCRICTLPGLDLDLEQVQMIRYRREFIDAAGLKSEEAAATAYVYVGSGCVRVWGEADIRAVRAAWKAWKMREEREGER